MALTGRAIGLGLAGLTALSAPAPAALRDTYAAALTAMEAEQWRRAESLFRESLAQHPTEARRLPFKRVFQPYLPHYYLGAVLARQGDCRGALVEWKAAGEQGVVDKIGLGDELRQRRSSCEERLESLARLTAVTESTLDQASVQAERLDDPSRAALLRLGVEGGLGSLGQRLRGARERMTDARAKLAQAEAAQDPELAREAYELALETSRDLDGALDEADRIAQTLDEERALKSDRADEVRQLARRVEDLLRSRGGAIRSRRQELESLLAGAVALPESASLEQIERLEGRLESFRVLLEGSAAPPPGTLRSGAIAYLRGDYQAVLERLAEIPYREGKSRAHCLLLRSAAAYALHLAGGESDAELLERAREDALAARRSVPDLVPVESAFTPRFVRFFETLAATIPGA